MSEIDDARLARVALGWLVEPGGRALLAGGGIAVVVLACGIDLAHPASHAGLLGRVASGGLLVSAWPPGAEPTRDRFAVRDRLLAAASRGTVAIQATAGGSAHRTLWWAERLGRRRQSLLEEVSAGINIDHPLGGGW